MINYAAVAAACRDAEIAESLFDRLRPFAEQVPTNVLSAYEPVSHHLAASPRPRPVRRGRHLLRPRGRVQRPSGASFFGPTPTCALGRDARRARRRGSMPNALGSSSPTHTTARGSRYAGVARTHRRPAIEPPPVDSRRAVVWPPPCVRPGRNQRLPRRGGRDLGSPRRVRLPWRQIA
jgi:hypothetical protein